LQTHFSPWFCFEFFRLGCSGNGLRFPPFYQYVRLTPMKCAYVIRKKRSAGTKTGTTWSYFHGIPRNDDSRNNILAFLAISQIYFLLSEYFCSTSTLEYSVTKPFFYTHEVKRLCNL
jgi:hypothetical protein